MANCSGGNILGKFLLLAASRKTSCRNLRKLHPNLVDPNLGICRLQTIFSSNCIFIILYL